METLAWEAMRARAALLARVRRNMAMSEKDVDVNGVFGCWCGRAKHGFLMHSANPNTIRNDGQVATIWRARNWHTHKRSQAWSQSHDLVPEGFGLRYFAIGWAQLPQQIRPHLSSNRRLPLVLPLSCSADYPLLLASPALDNNPVLLLRSSLPCTLSKRGRVGA